MEPRKKGKIAGKRCNAKVREYNAMHEENFLSSWLREDLEGKEERKEWTRKSEKEKAKR